MKSISQGSLTTKCRHVDLLGSNLMQ